MRFELQRADFWKRISALLFDIILLGVIILSAAVGLSAALKFDHYNDYISETENALAEQYGINLQISSDEYEALSPEERQKYNDYKGELNSNPRFLAAYTIRNNLLFVIPSVSILIGYIVTELIIPIFFKNGQTLGKKAFGLGVVHTNGVRMRGQAHFIRVIIGKCLIEVLVPFYFIMMMFLGRLGVLGIVMLVLMAGLELFSVITTKTRSTIHDLVSDTVVVDFASQMVFENADELMAYKTRIHEEMANKQEY